MGKPLSPGIVIASLLVGVVPLNSMLLKGGTMLASVDSFDTKYQAAQIALLVLRSRLESTSHIDSYIVNPAKIVVGIEAAARAIAAWAKPVSCEGLRNASIMTVSCSPLADSVLLERRTRRATQLTESLEKAVRVRCGEPVDNALILLVGNRGDTLRVRFGALAAWLRDYDMRYSLGWNDSEHPPEVCLVIYFVTQRAEVQVDSGG